MGVVRHKKCESIFCTAPHYASAPDLVCHSFLTGLTLDKGTPSAVFTRVYKSGTPQLIPFPNYTRRLCACSMQRMSALLRLRISSRMMYLYLLCTFSTGVRAFFNATNPPRDSASCVDWADGSRIEANFGCSQMDAWEGQW